MNRDNVRQLVNAVVTIVVIVVNILANALPLNGQNTGEISDRFKILFVPAGYVFSIWGLIYLGLLGFAFYQALPAQRENARLRRIGYWYAVAGAANIVWIFLWHYNVFTLTWVAMFLLLASLLVIYLRLRIGRAPVSTAERWLVNIPFSIYLGWITVATIANVTQVLYYLNWQGWGIPAPVWAVLLIAVATVVALLMTVTRRDIAYLLVLIWALIGIAVKQAGTLPVAIAAGIAAALIVAMVIALLVRRGRPPRFAA